jgi:hypothetical protein
MSSRESWIHFFFFFGGLGNNRVSAVWWAHSLSAGCKVPDEEESVHPSGGHGCFQFPWILLYRTPSWIHIPTLQRISSGTSPEYVVDDQPCFFNFFNSILSIPSSHNSSFFFSFPFSLLKNVVRCHAIHHRGDQLKMGRFSRWFLDRPESVDAQESTNK